jgi:hypothetical protein
MTTSMTTFWNDGRAFDDSTFNGVLLCMLRNGATVVRDGKNNVVGIEHESLSIRFPDKYSTWNTTTDITFVFHLLTRHWEELEERAKKAKEKALFGESK